MIETIATPEAIDAGKVVLEVISNQDVINGLKTFLALAFGASTAGTITVVGGIALAAATTVSSLYCRFTKTKDTKMYRFIEGVALLGGKAKDKK